MSRRGWLFLAVTGVLIALALACYALIYLGPDKTPESLRAEAEAEFLRGAERFDFRPSSFVFLRTRTYNAEGGAVFYFYWASKYNTEAEVIVVVDAWSIRLTGKPMIPNCRTERNRVLETFGDVCLGV